MAVSVLGLLVPVAIFIAIGIALAFAASRGRAANKITDPSCGKCSYNVRGLTTFTCPECGSDLREVGIVTPKRESLGGTLTKNIIGWTALMLLLTGIGFGCAMSMFTKQTSTNQTTVTLGLPKSGVFDHVKVIATSTQSRRFRSAAGPLVTTVSVELQTRAGTTVWPAAAQFNAAQILKMLEQAGVTGDKVQLQVEAQGIAGVIQTFASQGALATITMPIGFQRRLTSSAGTVTTNSSPPKVVVLGIPFLLWLIGVVLMVRDYAAQRHRRSVS